MVAYTTLAGDADTGAYADFRNALLTQLEGVENDPYVDTSGIPTIGVGLNLRVRANFDAVADLRGYTQPVRDALWTTLNRSRLCGNAACRIPSDGAVWYDGSWDT